MKNDRSTTPSSSDGPRRSPLPTTLNDVENAIGIHASSYCTMPAETIYDKSALAQHQAVIEKCHIYCIGYTPVVEFTGARQYNGQILAGYRVEQTEYELTYPIPDGYRFCEDGDSVWLEDAQGGMHWPSPEATSWMLSHRFNAMNFDIKYIGQAYGKDGSRTAIDRLIRHETLQKIAIRQPPQYQRLTLLLLEVDPSCRLYTALNPNGETKDTEMARYRAGMERLETITDAEIVSLFEASLIRHFRPEFNVEFKNSFPSTNLKLLQRCYDKDICTLIAEICIDGLPFKLCSTSVEPKANHIITHDLHRADERRLFFLMYDREGN